MDRMDQKFHEGAMNRGWILDAGVASTALGIAFVLTHRAVGEYSTVLNISPYTIIKFLVGSKYQDGTKYIFWTSKYKF